MKEAWNTDSPGSLERDDIAGWLLRGARDLPDSRAVIAGLCRRLTASGFPLYRLFVTARTLHPQVAAIGYQWRRGDAEASETRREHGLEQTEIYLSSPIKLIHDGAPEVRWRLTDRANALDFPILTELRAD